MSERVQSLQLIVDMLGRSIGLELAREVVLTTARELGIIDPVTQNQALRLLEQVAQQPGIVGIAARFGKSRVHMLWSAELGDRH